jgi:hypothetical protein
MLVEDLLIGHEFEFVYKGKTYGIVDGDKGNILCTDNKAISPDYEDILELLAAVKIDGKSIEEIFNEIEEYCIL